MHVLCMWHAAAGSLRPRAACSLHAAQTFLQHPAVPSALASDGLPHSSFPTAPDSLPRPPPPPLHPAPRRSYASLFWFSRPRVMLRLIQLIYFENSLAREWREGGGWREEGRGWKKGGREGGREDKGGVRCGRLLPASCKPAAGL